MKKIINVILCEKRILIRKSITALLNGHPMIKIIGELESEKELPAVLKKTDADIALLFVEMGLSTNTEIIKLLQLRFPRLKTIILNNHKEVDHIKQAILFNVKGYLTQNCLPDQLMEAILTVHSGGSYIEDDIIRYIANDELYRLKGAIPYQKLSDREKEVLADLCDGKTEKQIAAKLNISSHTVHFHRTNLYTKTKSHNLADLIKYASRANMRMQAS